MFPEKIDGPKSSYNIFPLLYTLYTQKNINIYIQGGDDVDFLRKLQKIHIDDTRVFNINLKDRQKYRCTFFYFDCLNLYKN